VGLCCGFVVKQDRGGQGQDALQTSWEVEADYIAEEAAEATLLGAYRFLTR
jgi:hypothetical protein